jgi:hypothetical protein
LINGKKAVKAPGLVIDDEKYVASVAFTRQDYESAEDILSFNQSIDKKLIARRSYALHIPSKTRPEGVHKMTD